MAKTKYIFVTGGVLSGVGKGITAASIGAVLQAKGIGVSVQKCDPYLNVDAGLLNPREHGECFVTKDGAETDLDLGHYERFLDQELTRKNTTLSGRLFRDLIADERAGKFGGQTVQLVPHFTNAIKRDIKNAAEGEVHIVEIGGTVGDFEAMSFIEAIRGFSMDVGRENCLFVHVVYVPFLGASQEYKTKPAQNAMAELRNYGIMPDVVAVRTEGVERPSKNIGEKIAISSGVPKDGIIMMPNVSSVYEVPMTVNRDLGKMLSEFTKNSKKANLRKWQNLAKRDVGDFKKKITVGLVVKYTDNSDTYLSITEALKSAAWAKKSDIEVRWIDSEAATDEDFARVDGILVPGGFGKRGISGKIAAATYSLKNNKPYLGVGLGAQVAVIAAARLGGAKDANSEEFEDELAQNVVYLPNSNKASNSRADLSMRLGDYTAKLTKGSKVAKIYKKAEAVERHRHRYEINQKFTDEIKRGGLEFSGVSADGKLVEFVESPKSDFFVATLAHPEFKSRPLRPHPLFEQFIKTILTK